jgi:hypothetical protein
MGDAGLHDEYYNGVHLLLKSYDKHRWREKVERTGGENRWRGQVERTGNKC